MPSHMSLMFREACKVGKVSIKGAAMKYEGIFNPSAQGCWDQQRLKGQDERLIISYRVDFQLVAVSTGERLPCLWAQSVQSRKHERTDRSSKRHRAAADRVQPKIRRQKQP